MIISDQGSFELKNASTVDALSDLGIAIAGIKSFAINEAGMPEVVIDALIHKIVAKSLESWRGESKDE